MTAARTGALKFSWRGPGVIVMLAGNFITSAQSGSGAIFAVLSGVSLDTGLPGVLG